MSAPYRVAKAYEAASNHRSQRTLEADLFRSVIAGLTNARAGSTISRVRAISDNRMLWLAIISLMNEPTNSLPIELRASIVSIGLAVQREMEVDCPDFDFLIRIDETFLEALGGGTS